MKYYYEVTYESSNGNYEHFNGVIETTKSNGKKAQAMTVARNIAESAGIKRILHIDTRPATSEDYE